MAEISEGTILTEGISTGKGTRFSTPKMNQRLDTGGRSRGIEGGKGGISQAAAIDIDARSATVKPGMLEPLQVKPTLHDGAGLRAETIENVGNTMLRTLNTYVDRVADSEAQTLALEYNDFARKAYFGEDESGMSGFGSLKGEAAVKGRQEYFDTIDRKMAELMDRADPMTQQKVLGRLSSIRDNALNRGASHIVQQQAEREKQLQVRIAEDATRELVVDHSSPERVESLKEQFSIPFGVDMEGRDKHWDGNAINSAHAIYLNQIRDKKSGIPQLEAFRANIKDTLTTEGRNRLEQYIEAQKSHERVQAEHQDAINRRQQNEMENAATVKALIAIEKDPARYTSPSNIVADYPELATDPAAVKSLMSSAINAAKGDVATPEEAQEVEMAGHDLVNAGYSFQSYGAFLKATEHLKLKPADSRRAWSAMEGKLKGETNVLNSNFAMYRKAVVDAFKTDKSLAIQPGIGQQSIVSLTNEKKLPPEALNLVNKLYTIHKTGLNAKKLPAQIDKEMQEAIMNEVAVQKLPIDKKANIPATEYLDALIDSYQIKEYVNKLEAPAGPAALAPEQPEVQQSPFKNFTGFNPVELAFKGWLAYRNGQPITPSEQTPVENEFSKPQQSFADPDEATLLANAGFAPTPAGKAEFVQELNAALKERGTTEEVAKIEFVPPEKKRPSHYLLTFTSGRKERMSYQKKDKK